MRKAMPVLWWVMFPFQITGPHNTKPSWWHLTDFHFWIEAHAYFDKFTLSVYLSALPQPEQHETLPNLWLFWSKIVSFCARKFPSNYRRATFNVRDFLSFLVLNSTSITFAVISWPTPFPDPLPLLSSLTFAKFPRPPPSPAYPASSNELAIDRIVPWLLSVIFMSSLPTGLRAYFLYYPYPTSPLEMCFWVRDMQQTSMKKML